MRIVVTTGVGPGAESWGNMGDVAQLQACVARLSALWPNASVNILTDSPANLARFCPTAAPLASAGRSLWVGDELPIGGLAHALPQPALRWLVRSRRVLAVRFPAVLKWLLTARLRLQNRQAEIEAVAQFSEAIDAADLVVVCGAGGFFDGCRDWNVTTLDVVEAAVDRRIPVAMFAQHFGPLTDPDVVGRAKRILPAVDLIGLRGNPGAPQLLDSFGVSPGSVRLTGDEAIELAFESRRQQPGTELGVNFRLRASTRASDSDIELIRPVLHRFARERGVSLVPVPIAVDSETSDHLAIQQLLDGFDQGSDGGARLSSPHDVIRQVAECRVLMTCAYHAAVFALAQGIPVVALAKSAYFAEKFQGLERQFGVGFQIVTLSDADLTGRLTTALEDAWQSAERVRLPLQDAARRQIEETWGAYRSVERLVARQG